MPSTMIHLCVAHEVQPEAHDFFWVGNFAPDYTNERALKDKIHLRDSADRWSALADFAGKIDARNPFERGWLLHLFTDACWEENELPAFGDNFVPAEEGGHWFPHYRNEIGLATYYLYHHTPWAGSVWRQIESANLDEIATALPITPEENAWYRDRVAGKHRESDPGSAPQFYTPDRLSAFTRATARRYGEWRGNNAGFSSAIDRME